MHASGPILNIPMLGAFGKITGYYDLAVMEKVIRKEFGESRLGKNMSVAKDAYESVKEGWDTYYWEPLKKMLEK